ncbi:glycine-tRNA ligase [Spizellomyces punctatus DAOM BR117]|uniref:glycine--tRNA ligase n=1 Tax=Spizellomyces punctatus (strain DAOM BR117) TaxID=645134 RepID=A0A0L0H4P1_SPIPD|nr:glycine-tRNA ligase [Spizellomyces punctatus DAOM BR117]KNC96480.1 glycine-tRNA ligase [Spizellomyces punctatus DAOM BR117]|eukprot:XP_016604520.1 glycine-tRNA ligase [Spizellomyces punctatus DAOM BR117]
MTDTDRPTGSADPAPDITALKDAIAKQGDVVKALKAEKAPKERLQPELDRLLALKEELKQLLLKEAQENEKNKFDRSGLESLLIKRFFYAPSFQIYGGIAGLYDYGPPGCALQNNILSLWRQHFVLEEDMLEVECTNLTPEAVLQTSGHVERFADYMVKDTKTGDIFRADHLVKQVLNQRLEDDTKLRSGAAPKAVKGQPKVEPLTADQRAEYELVLETLDNYQGEDLHQLIRRLDIRAPETGNEVTAPVLFNLMFETQIGPTGQFKGYLRPETAQGHFLNFKRLYEFNTGQMPFASASVGKSFRNEISPRQGLLRVREFTMAEIEHYVDPTKKDHPRFDEVRDVVLPLYSATAQEAAAGPTKLSIGEAVEKGIINNQTLGYFVARIYLFLVRIGVDPARLRMRQHMSNEMAHYACDCWDAEIQSSYGWIECVGCADRSAYDLTAHSNKTGEKLVVREQLPEPIIADKWVLDVNKKNFGPAFKKNAKAVQGYLDSLKEGDQWNEARLLDLLDKLNTGKATITGTDGNEYELTTDLIKIEKRTFKEYVREYIPSVIEPSFGIGRILYQLLEHSYYVREGDEQRGVLKFPACIAPIKALVLPISHSDEFLPFIKDVVTGLRRFNISNKVDDSGSSIGKRYARNDELGTPFAVTVDFQTVQDQTVTLRERDSTKQIREKISTVLEIIKDLVEEKTTWSEVEAKYPTFVQQEL